eukprot:scaffold1562_cov146-Isochrysis_galbana.AAC.6
MEGSNLCLLGRMVRRPSLEAKQRYWRGSRTSMNPSARHMSNSDTMSSAPKMETSRKESRTTPNDASRVIRPTPRPSGRAAA